MLFNWYTIDACFLSSSWQINSNGAFAATCIGVMLMVVLLEALRRLGKEFDDHLLREFQARLELLTASATPGEQHSVTFRASPLQQLIRAVIHAATFALAYIVMLLAMYGEFWRIFPELRELFRLPRRNKPVLRPLREPFANLSF